jgi:hypothetical protein
MASNDGDRGRKRKSSKLKFCTIIGGQSGKAKLFSQIDQSIQKNTLDKLKIF